MRRVEKRKRPNDDDDGGDKVPKWNADTDDDSRDIFNQRTEEAESEEEPPGFGVPHFFAPQRVDPEVLMQEMNTDMATSTQGSQGNSAFR